MAFGGVVIAFTGFNVPEAGVVPHPHSLLRVQRSSEHFDGKYGSGGG